VLGDSASGIASSGVSHSFTRREREPGNVAPSFTRQDGDFLEEQISLTFAFPLAGPRSNVNPTTPVDLDFEHDPGIDALLEACGLTGNASTADPTVGWRYQTADVGIATAKLWDSGFAWVVRDIRGDIAIAAGPGEIAIATCTLTGVIDSGSLAAFPTLDFGVQASVGAPSVRGVNPSWGISGEIRGWSDLTITVANEIQQIPDSASSTGSVPEQTGRTVTVAMTIRDTDTDVDFTRANLVGTTAPTDDLRATVGTPAAAGDPALAYQLDVRNLRVTQSTPAVMGSAAASQVTAVATSATADDEFSITFL